MDPIQIEHRLTRVEAAIACIPGMQTTLNEINTKFAKYEGRWGTITLIAAAFWAAFVAFKDEILKVFKG